MSRAVVTIAIGGKRQRFELLPGELATIGRSTSCQIRVADQSVSREHCAVVFTGDRVRVNDLAARHGIVFEGERVDQCDLLPGDRCKLGNAVFVFETMPGAAPPAPTDEIEAAIAATAAELAAETAAKPQRKGPAKEPAATPAETPAATAPEPDVQIDGYRILGTLGSGGFGTVYRAEQVRLGREIALKVLRLDPGDNDDAGERIAAFQREARAAAAIDDPRLVQVFDVGQDNGVHYLSMELVGGGNLTDRLRRHGPMPFRDVLAMMRDVAHALKAAHGHGIVHRDVKPANILLTSDGKAKLTDLGLAEGIAGLGTVAFMAPEQLLRREVDERTDIYALGCTAYAALVGRAPFTGDPKEVAKAHCKQTPPSFQRLDIKVPWHLEQLIIDAMMAKDPADRPANADELLGRIDRLVLPGTEPVPAGRRRDPDAPLRNRGPARKRLAARVLSELIVVTIIAVLVIATLLALKIGWDVDLYRLLDR